uniref:Uncharacterized protein n=1 Tax=viral metagenome TaxID=1070528 RepID=A0A6M3LHZ6_9ZZZZ
MAEDYPDFTRAVSLLGVDANGDPVLVLVDSAGNLAALLKGEDAGEVVRTVRVDDSGQLYAVLRGADDVDVAVDASGFLAALVKGIDGGEVLRTLAVDTSGQLVMVPRGQSGNYMAIDASGYMTAVLKGAHDAVLTTIGVDANGRIDAFLMDGSDQWGQSLRVGNADMVGRLGSPVTWDWRGNVLYMHDFSTGYGPTFTTTTGTGGAMAIGPERGGYGGYALKMTAGSDSTRLARVQLPVGVNPSARVGFAARFSIYSNTGYVRLMLERWTGATSPVGYAQIDVANKLLKVLDGDSVWQSLGSVPVSLSSFCHSWFKLVIDPEGGYYERVLYNDEEYDASAHTLASSVIAAEGIVACSVSNYGREGVNDIIYLDQIIVTVNEPANA